MHSCIYEGSVSHRRRKPVNHRFRYRLYMMYLDLDELDRGEVGHVFEQAWGWSTNASRWLPTAATFRREDHLGDPTKTLRQAVCDLVEAQGSPRPRGSIRLLTQLRNFGFLMNPVSFYFCNDVTGTSVETVVAEVNNTPWGERHCYVLNRRQRDCDELLPKVFHVSPFLPMDMKYRWRLSEPGESLRIHIGNHDDTGKPFEAAMQLKRREMTPTALNRLLLRRPLMTFRISAAIYWQAMQLWVKGVPYIPHPNPPKQSPAIHHE